MFPLEGRIGGKAKTGDKVENIKTSESCSNSKTGKQHYNSQHESFFWTLDMSKVLN